MNIDVIETLKTVGALVGPFIGAGGMWTYLARRAKLREPRQSTPAAMLTGQADFADMLNAQTKLLLEESAKDRKELRGRINRQGMRLARAEKSVADCQTKHLECELKANELTIRVETLMRGTQPAEYDELKRIIIKDC